MARRLKSTAPCPKRVPSRRGDARPRAVATENGRRPATDAEPEIVPLDAGLLDPGLAMEDELFGTAIDDDAGGLPHQLESNAGPVREGSVKPPRPGREPKSLPRKSPTL